MNAGDLVRDRPLVPGTKRRAIFLSVYSVLQSNLRETNSSSAYSFAQRRQRAVLLIWAVICAGALICSAVANDRLAAGSLGLAFPGGGFLHWAQHDRIGVALTLFVTSCALFGVAVIVWFATGNVVLPPTVWLASAILAAQPEWLGLDDRLAQPDSRYAAITVLAATLLGRRAIMPRESVSAARPALAPAAVSERRAPAEIALADLGRLRLLADRALQPIERFDGFEWRDQFQTAAVRYQVNFIAYALALARSRYAPAATAWFADAQTRLFAKQGDHRLWRYWALENAWGNLSLGRDPIPRDNIMSTGFIALQMAVGDTGAALDLRRRGSVWRSYRLDEMSDILADQYRDAPYGLLACEPNWIYPLCNLITACGVRAADARAGTDHWSRMAGHFGDRLLAEFTGRRGEFVAFRSSLTGFGAPGVGGAVMQTFPCLFLNSLYPDLAATHWEKTAHRARAKGWRSALWPIDVGNYGFSRAAGYAASAAAAAEMGDGSAVRELLDLLEADCPEQAVDGARHRRHASLWAHALELAARVGGRDELRRLIEGSLDCSGPHLAEADYPHVMIAAAHRDGEALRLVLYPGDTGGIRSVTIAGLKPARHYRTGLADYPFTRADETGRAMIRVPLHGRTRVDIVPVI